MSIKRTIVPVDEHYTIVPNAYLRDARLSLKARGLLGQLLSHRVGWTVSVEGLARVNPEGKAAIRGAINELEDAGYLAREQSHDEAGRFGEVNYVLTDPDERLPKSAPLSDYPTTDNPTTDNRTPKKNIIQKTSSKNVGDSVAGEFELVLEDAPTAKKAKASTDYSAEFEAWWARYPNKANKAKAAEKFAQRVREGMTATELDELLAGYLLGRQLAESRGEFVPPIPHAATWLNGRRWEDYPAPASSASATDTTAGLDLAQDDVDRILGRDYWTPPAPPAGLDLLAERQWRAARVAEHQAERRQAALARLSA